MAVTLDSFTQATRTSAAQTSYSVNHTVSGTDRHLEAIGVVQNVAAQPTSVTMTYGSISMNAGEIVQAYPGTTGNSNQWWLYRFYLTNPPVGTDTLTITSLDSAYLYILAASFNGVDQTTPVDTSVTTQAVGSPIEASMTSSKSGWWYICAVNVDTVYDGVTGVGSVLRDTTGAYQSFNMADTNGEIAAQSNKIGMTFAGTRDNGGVGVVILPVQSTQTKTDNALFFGGGV